jgi:phage tail sheath protein FI
MGKLVVEVGIAPVKPAEFVVFRISQQKQSAA